MNRIFIPVLAVVAVSGAACSRKTVKTAEQSYTHSIGREARIMTVDSLDERNMEVVVIECPRLRIVSPHGVDTSEIFAEASRVVLVTHNETGEIRHSETVVADSSAVIRESASSHVESKDGNRWRYLLFGVILAAGAVIAVIRAYRGIASRR